MKVKGKLITDAHQDISLLIELIEPKIRETIMEAYTKGFMKALSLAETDLKNYIEK